MNQNGKKIFTSWRKSMTEFKFSYQQDPRTKDTEIPIDKDGFKPSPRLD